MSETLQPDPRVETARRRVLAGLHGIKHRRLPAPWRRVDDGAGGRFRSGRQQGRHRQGQGRGLRLPDSRDRPGTELRRHRRHGHRAHRPERHRQHLPQPAGRHRHLAGHVGVRRQGLSSLFSATSRKGYVAFSGYRHRFDRKWPLHRTIEPARPTTGAGRRRFIFDKSVKKTVSWTG